MRTNINSLRTLHIINVYSKYCVSWLDYYEGSLTYTTCVLNIANIGRPCFNIVTSQVGIIYFEIPRYQNLAMFRTLYYDS